jgi:hypothetical protein
LLISDPEQPNGFWILTRRGRKLKTAAAVTAYRQGIVGAGAALWALILNGVTGRLEEALKRPPFTTARLASDDVKMSVVSQFDLEGFSLLRRLVE